MFKNKILNATRSKMFGINKGKGSAKTLQVRAGND